MKILKSHFLKLLFISWGFTSPASTFNNLDNYFKLLSEMNYENAEKIAHSFQNDSLKKYAVALSKILYYERQKYVEVSFSKTDNDTNLEIKAVKLLVKGYLAMYQEPEKNQASNFFKKALQASRLSKKRSIIKRALLGNIENLSNELVHYHDQYTYFINEYKSLITEDLEYYWVYCYNIRFSSQKDVEKADSYIKKQTKKLEKIVSSLKLDHPFYSNFYSYLGYCLEREQKFNNAMKAHRRAINISKNHPFLNFIAFRSAIRLSEIERVKGDSHNALKIIDEAYNYIDRNDSITGLHYLNFYAASNYYKLKDYKNAYDAFTKAYEFEHELNGLKNSIENSTLAIQLKTSEKEKENLKLKADNLEIESKRKQNQNLLIGSLGLLIFGSITFLLIQKNTKRKQLLAIQEKELESQKVTNLLKEQELSAIDAMIEGQEKERQRIANDLHDDLGGLMATVKLHFNALKENQSPELYKKTTNLLDEAYNKVRSVAHAKNSGVMANKGLLKALNDMANTVSASNQLQVDIIDHGLDDRLENSLELTIFRIIQELITNVIKHAEATEVSIHITKHDESLNIMVEDNGKGFNTKNISKNSGMGIHSIDKRIESLGGKVTIESEIHKGTTIIIDIPFLDAH